MKFALNVVALAVGVVVLWTAPVQSFSNASREFVLDVTADDEVWAKYLNVGIKLNSKNLSVAAQKVLIDLNVLKVVPAKSAPEPDQGHTPGGEPKPEEGQAAAGVAEEQDHVVVARALHIVVEVASRYSKHGVALDFALDAIASAIKCNTLMHVLVQLNEFEIAHKQQNDAIISQPPDVSNTLVHILDTVAALKESIDEEFELYQQWEVVATQVKTKELPPDFEVFKQLVENTLTKSCELSSFEQIKKHVQLEVPKNWKSEVDVNDIFKQCQNNLKNMFENIPVNTMDIEVWKHFLDKSKYEESTEPV